MRIGQVEGEQAGDVAIFNADDHKEHFDPDQSVILNTIQGSGNLKYLTYFYSQPSRENIMFKVTEDTTKNHLAWSGARCSPAIYRLRDNTTVPPHRSCQTNLAEVLVPYGIGPDDIPGIFNVFMNVSIKDNKMTIERPVVKKEDYIDMLAEMNCLVAISACPSDRASTNSGRIKPLRVQIFEKT